LFKPWSVDGFGALRIFEIERRRSERRSLRLGERRRNGAACLHSTALGRTAIRGCCSLTGKVISENNPTMSKRRRASVRTVSGTAPRREKPWPPRSSPCSSSFPELAARRPQGGPVAAISSAGCRAPAGLGEAGLDARRLSCPPGASPAASRDRARSNDRWY
jgi:hypothetical protein